MKQDIHQNKFKRFLYPVYQAPRMYARIFFWQSLLHMYSVYVIWVVKHVTELAQLKDTNSLISTGIVFGVVSAIYFLCTRLTVYYRRIIPNFDAVKILQTKYIKDFIGLDNSEVEKLGTGKIINIIDNGIRVWKEMVKQGILEGVKILVILGISLYTIISFAGIYGILFFLFFGVVIYLFNYMTQKAKYLRKYQKELRVEYQRQLVKIVMSKNEILQGNKIDHEIEKLNKNIDESKKYSAKTANVTHVVFMIPDYTVAIMRCFVFCYMGYLIIHGEFKMEIFVPLIAILAALENTFSNFVNLYTESMENIVEVEKLREVFDTIPKMKGLTEGNDFLYKNGTISLQNISFSYNKTPVFSNFSFTLPGGKKTAFVGPSGGGKTTLIKLLAGYISPDTGKILIDDQDMSTIKVQSYYAHIGYLTQDPSVFDGTILENLMYGLSNSPSILEGVRGSNLSDQINTVISLSKCDFIHSFEKGRDTEIGERGIRLSGGQKQRLAIAKIMLKNPQLIFLDEPTSAMDSFNEEEVTQALHNLFQGRTVVVVAHRLQTVKQADKIYYIEPTDHGAHIVEEGTHDELVQKGGKYKKMLDLQSGF